MLFETLSHTSLLVSFLALGIIGGTIFDVGNFIKFLFANKKVPSVVIDVIQTTLATLLALFANVKLNYGLLRLFPFLIYFASFILERFTLGKLLAKGLFMCYNFVTKRGKKKDESK